MKRALTLQEQQHLMAALRNSSELVYEFTSAEEKAMKDEFISLDQYLTERKSFVKSAPGGGDMVMKATRAPRSWNPEKRTISFVMSSEAEDRDKDIIKQEGLGIDGFLENPTALLMHNHRDWPVGNWKDVEKVLTGRPKRTEGTLALLEEGKEPNADRLASHFDAGSIRACSIGFLPRKMKRRIPAEDKDEYTYPGYEILESEMLECSPVNIPSNPSAYAKGLISKGEDVVARDFIESILDNWMKHPETGLIIPRAEFEDAHKEVSGHRSSFSMDHGGTTVKIDSADSNWFKRFNDFMFGGNADTITGTTVLKASEPSADATLQAVKDLEAASQPISPEVVNDLAERRERLALQLRKRDLEQRLKAKKVA